MTNLTIPQQQQFHRKQLMKKITQNNRNEGLEQSNSKLQFSRKALESILKDLAKSAFHQQYFYNYQNIFEIWNQAINGTITPHHQPFLTNQLLQQLRQKHTLSTILYAIAIKAFQLQPSQVNYQSLERHRLFVSPFTSKPSVLLQSFINVLDQHQLTDIQQIQALLVKISIKIGIALEEARSLPSNLAVKQSVSEKEKRYRTNLWVNSSKQVSLQTGTLIYSSHSNYYQNDKATFFRELFKKMQEKFGHAASNIIEEVLLLHATAVYLETISLRLPKTQIAHTVEKGFPMEMPFYQQLAGVQSFQISFTFLQNESQQSQIELAISFKPENVKKVPIGEYQQKQRAFVKDLAQKSPKVTSKWALVQNLVYLIDTDAKLGEGTYGSVYKCQSLQLIQQRTTLQGNCFLFERKTMAAKQLRFTPQEQGRMAIPLSREHLLLSLIGELRHRQAIKDVQRGLGYAVQRNLVGIEHIVSMVQYFKVAATRVQGNERRQRERETEEYFIIFSLGNASLSNSAFCNSFYKSPTFLPNMHSLFLRIFQALTCLHFDINNLYPQQLYRYFSYQINDNFSHESVDIKLTLPGKNGIIHRDLKPSNIVVNWDSQYRVTEMFLIDFGMARIDELSSRNGATCCGSTYYMAPEVRNGSRQDQRVDVWSVGVFLFEMLCAGNAKLYSLTEAHSMSAIDQRLHQHIEENLNDRNGSWFKLTTQALTLIQARDGQEAKDSRRRSSQQIMEYLLREEMMLTEQEFTLALKWFHSAEVYRCVQSKGGKMDIFVEKNEGNMFNYLQNELRQKYVIVKGSLRQILRKASSQQRQSIMTAALAYAKTRHKSGRLTELKTYLVQLEVLLIANRSLNNDSEYTILIKQSLFKQAISIDDDLLKDIEQNVILGEVNEKKGNWVLVDTNVTVHPFTTTTASSPPFYQGYTLSQNTSICCKLYSPTNSTLSPWMFTQYQNQNQLFKIKPKDHQDYFDLYSLKIYETIGLFEEREMLKMVRDSVEYLLKQMEENDKRIELKESTQQGHFGLFLHLMRIDHSHNSKLVVKFNSSFLTQILQNSPTIVFQQKIKTQLRLLIRQPNFDLAYSQKLQFSIFLDSSSFFQFTNIGGKVLSYSSLTHVNGNLGSVKAGLQYLRPLLINQLQVKEMRRIYDSMEEIRNLFKQITLGEVEQEKVGKLMGLLQPLQTYFKELPNKFHTVEEVMKTAVLTSKSACQICNILQMFKPYIEAIVKQ